MSVQSVDAIKGRRVFKARSRSRSGAGALFDRHYPTAILVSFLTISVLRGVGAAIAIALTLVYVIRNRRAVFRRPLLLMLVLTVPLLALASTFWSIAPLVTLRSSLELGITALIGAMLALTKDRDRLLSACFNALSITIGLCVLGEAAYHGRHPGAFQGIYDNKNELATVAMFAVLAALTVCLSSKSSFRRKAIAVAVVAVSLAMFIGARSAGALVALGLGSVMIGVAYFIRRSPGSWRFAMVVTAVATLIAGAAVLLPDLGDLRTEVPIMLGKNPNITGRTYLWSAAKSTISNRPVLGYGYRTFWKSDLLGATAIKQAMSLPADANFNFHNEYFEAGVDLGLVGITAFSATLGLMVLAQIWMLVRATSLSQGFFTASAVAMALRSAVETSLVNQFTFFTTMFFMLVTLGATRWRQGGRSSGSRRRSRRARRRSGQGRSGQGRGIWARRHSSSRSQRRRKTAKPVIESGGDEGAAETARQSLLSPGSGLGSGSGSKSGARSDSRSHTRSHIGAPGAERSEHRRRSSRRRRRSLSAPTPSSEGAMVGEAAEREPAIAESDDGLGPNLSFGPEGA